MRSSGSMIMSEKNTTRIQFHPACVLPAISRLLIKSVLHCYQQSWSACDAESAAGVENGSPCN